MAILDHAVCLVQAKYVNHGQFIIEVLITTLIQKFPKTTWRRYDNSWLVREQALLLLDGHASDKRANLDLFFIFHWNDCLYVILDLDGKLASGTHDKSLDTRELRIILHKLFNEQVHNRYAEAQSLALSSFRCDHHVYMCIKVYETLFLHLCGL